MIVMQQVGLAVQVSFFTDGDSVGTDLPHAEITMSKDQIAQLSAATASWQMLDRRSSKVLTVQFDEIDVTNR